MAGRETILRDWDEPEMPAPSLGLVAEFRSERQLLRAGLKARRAGYRRLRAYAPYPVHDFAAALRARRGLVPSAALVGAVAGGLAGYWIPFAGGQAVFGADFPLDLVGYVMAVVSQTSAITGAIAGVVGMLALQRLPWIYGALFAAACYHGAARDRYLLLVEAEDSCFDPSETRRFLHSLGALRISGGWT